MPKARTRSKALTAAQPAATVAALLMRVNLHSQSIQLIEDVLRDTNRVKPHWDLSGSQRVGSVECDDEIPF